MPYLRITNDESMRLHQNWCAEGTKRGVYFTSHHNGFLSTAYNDKDGQQTLEIVHDAFTVLKERGL